MADKPIDTTDQQAATPWFAWPARKTWEEVRVRLRSRDGNEWEEIASDFEYWMQSADGEMCDDVVAFQIIGETPFSLASVSSASADGASGMKTWLGGDAAPADWDGGRVLFRHGGQSTSSPGEGMCWSHGMLGGGKTDIIAYTPKPEPVPATNQAGEVEPAVCAHGMRAPWQCHECDAENPPPPGYDPLATQPARSNADHRHPGWTDAGHKWLDAGCPPVAATQPATSQEGEGTLANPSTFGKPTFGLATTPTPPTLSEDLRALGQAIGAEIERQCSIGAGTCGTADDGSGLFEVNASLDLNGFAQAMSGAALAQVKAS